jgi:hypothetical protein
VNKLQRLALKLLGAVGTVFIAACYGVRNLHVPQRGGVVADARSGAPIPGVLVTCLGNDGGMLDQDVTDEQGRFEMRPDCAAYRAEDVDGATNGTYATATASFGEVDAVIISLEPVP